MKSSFTKFRVFVLLSMLAIGVIGVWFWRSLSHLPKELRHIVLVSIDTCRADYLSCYGYSRQTTPNIDKLAEESILFENVVTPVPLTLPAHSSMLTGTIPLYHGIHDNLNYQLGQSNVTLAEILKEAGFTTGAIISSFVMDSQFGLDQGFDTYNDEFEQERKTPDDLSERIGAEASRFAVEWLEQHKDEEFFLFLHYFDPHTRYEPPEPFASKFRDNLYAGEIAYTDDCIGVVIKKLKDLGLYDSSLIIITGDHGEMLGEHGEEEHGYFIYQAGIKVPLIFKLPGLGKGERIDEPVGLIDIVPTICSALGIAIPSGVQGKALFGQSRPGKDRYIYCESLYATKYGGNSLLGVVTDEFKYIQTTRPELYNLIKDPQESNDLVLKQPKQAELLKKHLESILEQQLRKDDSDSKLELDEEGIKRLESLGYIGGSISEDFKFDQSKDDPKDLIDFHRRLGEVVYFISREKYTEGKKLCEEMLRQRPDFLEGHAKLAEIAMKTDGYVAAIPHLYRALELKPDFAKVRNNLGMALSVQGKLDEAVPHFQQALQIRPKYVEAHNNLGITLIRQNKLVEALSHFRQALQIKPNKPETYNNMGFLLSVQGKLDEAISYYRQALQIKPDFAKSHYHLAGVLARQGKLDEAITHLTEVVQLKPNSASAHYILALALNDSGRTDGAVRHFKEALRVRPGWANPMNNLAWLLATHKEDKFRNPEEAIRLSERACELTDYKEPLILDTLSASYASAGRFSEAVQTAEKAMDLLISSGQKEAASQVAKHLKLFKAGQPCRNQRILQISSQAPKKPSP